MDGVLGPEALLTSNTSSIPIAEPAASTGRPQQALGQDAHRAGDRSGFIVNALLIPYLISAIRMYEEGFATRRRSTRG